MPARPAIQANIHGKVDRDDYTVEKVYFESHPGQYVTGSLYRPKNMTGSVPLVILPARSLGERRFHDHGEAKIKTETSPEQRPIPSGGRHPLQARCVHLARMGFAWSSCTTCWATRTTTCCRSVSPTDSPNSGRS